MTCSGPVFYVHAHAVDQQCFFNIATYFIVSWSALGYSQYSSTLSSTGPVYSPSSPCCVRARRRFCFLLPTAPGCQAQPRSSTPAIAPNRPFMIHRGPTSINVCTVGLPERLPYKAGPVSPGSPRTGKLHINTVPSTLSSDRLFFLFSSSTFQVIK